jgi:Ni/Co efflux regulator RcnB
MNRRSITACALALSFLAVSGKAARAQDRGQDHRTNAADRQAMQQHQFNDNDRQATRDWARQNQRHLGAGWRQRDRLSPGMQGRLRRGQRLDPQLRSQIHWVPADLSRRYGPAPRGYRYAMIGGNVVMLDDSYQVQDVFTLSLNF